MAKPRGGLAFSLFACLCAGGHGCASIQGLPGDAIIKESTRVEVFRVAPRDDSTSDTDSSTDKTQAPDATTEPRVTSPQPTIGGYRIIATGKEQGPEFAARLSKVLRSNGVSPNRKKCGLEPGVAYRLWSGNKAVEVLVCFNCDVLWPHVVGTTEVRPGEDWSHEWKDFDPVRPQLLALTKEAFPDDTEIQKLKEGRE